MSSALPDVINLRVVMYRDGEYCVAHCVELDLLTSATTMEEAWKDIQDVCRGQILYACEHDPEFKHLFRPPSESLMRMMSLGRERDVAVVRLDGKSKDGKFAASHDMKIEMVVAECCPA